MADRWLSSNPEIHSALAARSWPDLLCCRSASACILEGRLCRFMRAIGICLVCLPCSAACHRPHIRTTVGDWPRKEGPT